MQDILDRLEDWRRRGEQIAIATVVNTWGSAPRPIGAHLATTLSGSIAGSVSAGCVEGAVVEACRESLKNGRPKLLSFGVADDTAWEVGLACGGTIEVMTEPFAAWGGVYPSLKRHLATRSPLAVIGVLSGPEEWLNRKLLVLNDGGTEGDLPLPAPVATRAVPWALELLAQGTGGSLELEDGTVLFAEVYPPVPRLIIVGAVHIAQILVSLATLAGFDAIVIDPRGAFASPERFPHATQLLVEWPQHVLERISLDRFAYVAVLTHDPKLDDPSLRIALTSRARYVGALGSRRTNDKRRERLREQGLSEAQIARLHAPIGLPLRGRSPGEIAVSILAEIVEVKNNPHVPID